MQAVTLHNTPASCPTLAPGQWLARACGKVQHTRPIMQKLDFTLDGEYVELNQLLKLVGICDSGGAGKALVAGGDVRVDGKTELRKTCKIRAGQVVSLGDVRIRVVSA